MQQLVHRPVFHDPAVSEHARLRRHVLHNHQILHDRTAFADDIDPRHRRHLLRLWLSPADGRVIAIERLDRHEAIEGAAVVIRIFLSVLDVHVNRVPCAGEVVSLRRSQGKFLDARSPRSPVENESNLVTLRLPVGRLIGVRQIVGKIARRIVCDLKPGQRVARGERMGMIKFGSGTELILPQDLVADVHVSEGDRVKGGMTRVATLK